MVKKLQKMAQKKSGNGLMDHQLAGTVKESAQQIWLAGLGAFAKAQEEGGKVFEALVKEGLSLQRKTRSAAEDRLEEVSQKMTQATGELTHKAGQQWDKLEQIFEARVSKALGKLGVPSARDVDALVRRIDALNDRVAALSGQAPAASKTRGASRKTAAAASNAKPAAKPRASSSTKAATQAPAKPAARKKAAAPATARKTATRRAKAATATSTAAS